MISPLAFGCAVVAVPLPDETPSAVVDDRRETADAWSMPVIVIRVVGLAVLRAQWLVWRLRGRPGPNPMKSWKHVYSLPDIVPIFHHSDCGPSRQEGDSAQV